MSVKIGHTFVGVGGGAVGSKQIPSGAVMHVDVGNASCWSATTQSRMANLGSNSNTNNEPRRQGVTFEGTIGDRSEDTYMWASAAADYLDTTSDASLYKHFHRQSTSWSMAFVFQPPGLTSDGHDFGQYAIFGSMENEGGTTGFLFDANNGDDAHRFYVRHAGATRLNERISVPIAAKLPQVVLWVRDGTGGANSLRCYVNNVLRLKTDGSLSTDNTSNGDATAGFLAGGTAGGLDMGQEGPGKFWAFAYWNRVLSSTEINQIWDHFSPQINSVGGRRFWRCRMGSDTQQGNWQVSQIDWRVGASSIQSQGYPCVGQDGSLSLNNLSNTAVDNLVDGSSTTTCTLTGVNLESEKGWLGTYWETPKAPDTLMLQQNNSSATVSRVKIEVSADLGATWTTIASASVNQGGENIITW